MSTLRVTRPVDPKTGHICNQMSLDKYSIREVILPKTKKRKTRKALEITVSGRNLRAIAQPLFVFVGKVSVRWIRISPDERSVTGILLTEPEQGSIVKVQLGEMDQVAHPDPIDPAIIKRIGEDNL